MEKIKAVSKDRLELSVPSDWVLADGESVAVNGACLTVISHSKGSAAFEMSPETFKKTALGSLKKNVLVNLERAMKADGRFGGHFVTGHVDGAARLLGVRKAEGSFVLTFGRFEGQRPLGRHCHRLEADSAGTQLVEKGSVALNGVSLTVYDLDGDTFKTAVIPHTWKNTNFKYLKAGDALNIEYDILGKYAQKKSGGKITKDYLTENGF